MPCATRIWSSVRSPTLPTLPCRDPALEVVDDAALVKLASIEEPVLVSATTGGRWSDPRNRFLGVPRIVCWTGMRRALVALTESMSRVPLDWVPCFGEPRTCQLVKRPCRAACTYGEPGSLVRADLR